MDKIRLIALEQIDKRKIIELMNNKLVGKQLPLLSGGFSADDCDNFLSAKKHLWDTHGYGPWAFLIEEEFAGWGGLQPESGEADFALVLHPNFWGWGRQILNKIKEQAFDLMNLDSFIILLPPSRPNSRAVTRFGFVADGELTISGETFLRFRLYNPAT